MMNDFVTSSERMDFTDTECVGCGKTGRQIMKDDDISSDELDKYSKVLNCGWWYCHVDCYRDAN